MTARIDRHDTVRVANATTVVSEGHLVVCTGITEAMRIAYLLDSHGWQDEVGELPPDPFVDPPVTFMPMVTPWFVRLARRWWG